MRVYDDGGRPLTLATDGRSGGEGTVSRVNELPGTVAKIYHANRRTKELEDKVRAMCANPPRDPAWDGRRHRSIAWPDQMLWHDAARTDFAGFAMTEVDPTFREAHTAYDPGDRIGRFGGAFTWRHLMTAAMNLTSSVAAIHAEGHRVGDLRETNLLVAPSALITLIDCDSFQVLDRAGGRTFATRVGTAEYLPPELQSADFATDHDRTGADLFALGVLVFRFLMLGVHPFQATGPAVAQAPTTAAKISLGAFPYARRRGVAPPAFAPPFDALPPALRRMFVRCFVDGHRRPARRPSAAAWFGALKAEVAALESCSVNPNHVTAGGARSCPWCAMGRSGPDPFPAPSALGAQVSVPAAVVRRAAPARPPSSSASAPSVSPTSGSRQGVVTSALRFGRALGPRRSLRVARALGPSGLVKVARGVARSRRTGRVSPRRIGLALGVASVLVLLASPVGHSAEPPEVTTKRWRAEATGNCPSTQTGTIAGCEASWRLGPVDRTVERARTLFLVRSERVTLTVPFTVRFAGDGTCSVPWIDHLSFERSIPPVCLGPCPARIEVHGPDGRAPLLGATGVAARGGPLPCDLTHRGAWRFDVTGLSGPLSVRYPGLDPLTLPDTLGG